MTVEQVPAHVSGEVLSAFTDGELAADDRRFVEAHLQACATCRGAVLNYLNTGVLVRGLAVHQVPEQLGRDFLQRLAATGNELRHHPAA